MTREEAIKFGKRVIDLGFKGETQEFCEVAVKSLENESDVLDKVLELIDELNDTKTLVKATLPGSYLHKTYARMLKRAVLTLKGGAE